MEILANQLASMTLGASGSEASGRLPADQLAVARFAEIMDAQPTPVAQAVQTSLAAVSPSQASLMGGGSEVSASAVQGPRTLGDQVLAGMQNLSEDFQQSWKTVSAALESGSAMTTSDMLKLQMGLTQMSIQYELVGKAISRSTQNLDQLVKLQ